MWTFRHLSRTRELPQRPRRETPHDKPLQPPTFVLSALPNELITHVMAQMSPQSLARIESTSTTMRALAKPAWRTLYGLHPPHRSPERAEAFKTLFVEREMLRNPAGANYLLATDISPGTFYAYSLLNERLFELSTIRFDTSPDMFVDRLVAETDTDLVLGRTNSRAAEVFLALMHEDNMRGSVSYNEAVALALMAAGRVREAEGFRPTLQALPPVIQARHFLHMARFSLDALWPNLCWQDASEETRAQGFVVASAAGQIREIEFILALGKAPDVPYLTTTAARAGAANNQHEVLALLQSRGVDVGLHPPIDQPPAIDGASATAPVRPIIDAIRTGSLKAAQYLLAQGIDVDLVERTDISDLYWIMPSVTAWSYAVSLGRLPMITTLFDALPAHLRSAVGGMLRLAPLFDLVTAQMMSSHAAQQVLTMLLTEQRIDIDAQDARGRTAMHLAAEKGLLPLVQTLLEHGADLQASSDCAICSPLELAESGKHEAVAAFLASALGQLRDVDFLRTKTALLSDIMKLRKDEMCQVTAQFFLPSDLGLGADASEQTLLEFVKIQYDTMNIHQKLVDAAMPIWSLESMQKHHDSPGRLPPEQEIADMFDAAVESLLTGGPASNTGHITVSEGVTEHEQRVRRLAVKLYPDMHLGPEDIRNLSAVVSASISQPELAALDIFVGSDAFVQYFANQLAFDQALTGVFELFRSQLLSHI